MLSVKKSIVRARESLSRSRHSDEDFEEAANGPLHESIKEEVDAQVLIFNKLCSEIIEGDEVGWEHIRYWLRSHNLEEVKDALQYTGDNNMTPLHCVCRSNPPEDIINTMTDIGPDALYATDAYGWLPLHYACACSASSEVITRLFEEAPYAKTTVDRRGRAPVHFALSNLSPTRPITANLVANLINTGAASYPDDNGMLPLHYACAYGADPEIIQTLVEEFPDALITTDERGRTPLIFCLANCDREYAAFSVRYMLDKNKNLVNKYQGDQVPLHALSDHAHHVKDPEGMSNCAKCLELYMNTEPIPTADLISAIQQLPDFLLEEAVHLKVVQVLLNQKTSQPFPTAVLMMDFYILIVMVVSYSTLTLESIHRRFDDDPTNDAMGGGRVAPLYVGCSYFLTREFIQLVGVGSLGALSTYFTDATNLLDIIYISLVMYWTNSMHTGSGAPEVFRTGAGLTLGLMYINAMVYLKNVVIDLAIFVAGVIYVVQRLGAFLMATIIFLVAFAQIFVTIYQQSDYCLEADPAKDINDIRCSSDTERPYCSFWPAFLRVLNMMLGAVDDEQFKGSAAATGYYILFFFVVVIMLANVLIAIVTDSYSVVRDERAAIVFWTNRLDFVGEMDAIANGPWTTQTRRWLGLIGEEDQEKAKSGKRATFGSSTWNAMLNMFEEEVEDLPWWSWDSWSLFFRRLVIAFLIIPVWLFLGLTTAGLLWPPEIREFVFVEAIATRLSEGGTDSAEVQRILEVEAIQEEVEEMKADLTLELTTDRANTVQIHAHLAEFRIEILGEVKDLKENMAHLVEQQAKLQ